MSLGVQQNSGKGGPENIGDGQGNPDTVQTVQAHLHVQHRNQDAHGHEEDHLA